MKFLSKYYPDYLLIGRVARNIYAIPETTLDIDFLVDLDDKLRLSELMQNLPLDSQIFPKDLGHWQYRLVVRGIRIDLVKPKGFILTEEVISRRRIVNLEKVGKIQVISPEDLALLYVLASMERGVRDLIKAKDVMDYSRARHDFNTDYFLKRCNEHKVIPLCIKLISLDKVDKFPVL
ncbi:nucleotidyltransferase family protein [Metallosphaera hakonensis]|uniref:nucleotidyltransferase family protein n=1 Tax=Metallosphaera hakonensis TaxID=79601 RepID=UPI000A560D4F|nr:nucleotidyltransferase family protein [Metallosphaera hakonensis]